MGTADLTYRKLVYQKDMSEYCRRQVIPAVFLGKQVVDANSQILHFSRLEMPYSCFITVRTEMGSNIIVVIQVVIDINLQKSCKKGIHQLRIHEVGETFGGYWGQMPDSVLRPRRSKNDNTYTLRPSPTQPPTTTTESTTTSPPTEKIVLNKTAVAHKHAQDDGYIGIVVPILNVSAIIVPGKIDSGFLLTTEDNFDNVFDVTPRNGESYITKEVPLLEIELNKTRGSLRNSNNYNEDDSLSQFQIEINNIFTPDPRLMFTDYGERTFKRKSHKYRPNVLKRLDFKKHNNLFVAKRAQHNKRPSYKNRRPHLNIVPANSKLKDVRHPVTHRSEETEVKSHYWDAIHDILNNLSKSSEVFTQPPHKELANILRGASNNRFNENVTSQNQNHVSDKPSKIELKPLNGTDGTGNLDSLAVSLVDHESFENIVQSASAMAVKLNQTKVSDVYTAEEEIPVHRLQRSRIRKKRYLSAIEIKGAKPHQRHKMKHMTTTKAGIQFNKRQFQRLIEFQDDEMSERVAMQYLPEFMGQPVLDFCDFNETTTKYVFLFNTSRLVLALSNFTIKRMTVVLTPSRTLQNSELRCGPSHIECQISGARVCIDSLSACDGVPNCGSFDIYDEDRLSCGAASGFRHNVCLAAITFLAVLLTVLYTIHYWLKRCVPKVSDAFFIYTDAAENVLYLDSIMKSPHDIRVSKDFFCGVRELLEYENQITKQNVFRKFMTRCLPVLRFWRKKSADEVVTADIDQLCSERLSAFAELEIQNMTTHVESLKDTAVQTGSSLHEMLDISPSIYSKDVEFPSRKFVTSSTEAVQLLQVESDSSQPSDELNILQFLRKLRVRSISLQQDTLQNDIYELRNNPGESSTESPTKEKEIRSEMYEHDYYEIDKKGIMEQPRTSEGKLSCDINDKPTVKHLRFQDDAIVLSPKEPEDDTLERGLFPRRSIIFGVNKVFRIQEPEEVSNDAEESATSSGRELKSYFNWGKEKKKKKPKKK
ncbi:unnamed protein product [Arctia plantaginis]|uniref:Uncharacterized protein n=1 Tax=Arctia plantaginis TaxID=874455 RepID=A0A8S0ZVD8_ARCPL|nr:unnamed protein product [Arctia plantaginis]